MWLPLGIILLVIGGKLFTGNVGKTERPAIIRFIYGVVAGAAIMLG